MSDVDRLQAGWRGLALEPGDAVIVHSSLSALGPVRGGAGAVAESLVRAVGPGGTVVAPTFTPQVRDPVPGHTGPPTAEIRARRDAVALFDPATPSEMGAIPEALRLRDDALRSAHPQVSVTAVGRHAAAITAPGPLGFALGAGSAFERLYDLDAKILLVGVGHDRNSFLHHAETRTPRPRLKLRRFPLLVGGERIWCEVTDVADDNGVHFPVVGRDFEAHAGIVPGFVGAAECRLFRARAFVDFAVPRLTRLLDDAQAAHANRV